MSKGDKTVLSYFDVCLKESDVALLDGPFWLNDKLISFAFEYFSQEVFGDSGVVFVDPDFVQLIKFTDTDCTKDLVAPLDWSCQKLTLLPVNNSFSTTEESGSHWSLLAYSRHSSSFLHFDPLGSSGNCSVAKELAEKLWCAVFRDSFSDAAEFRFESTDCPKQTNAYDCGVYVVSYAENLAAEIDLTTITPKTVEQKRKNLKEIILSKDAFDAGV